MPINVKDATGATVALETPNANGRAAAAASRPVALSNEDFAVIDNIETLIAGTNTALATLNSAVDGLEGQTGSLTETAPATDTASSGLNGRLQRVAQRLTSVITVLPTALGQGTKAQSLAVTLASNDDLVAATGTTAATTYSDATGAAAGSVVGLLKGAFVALSSLGAKFGAIGQQNMAGSASVVIASNQSAVPTIADNFARAIGSTTLTRQANTTAYAAGQLVGGSATAGFTNNGLTFASFARVSGGVVQLTRARLYKSQATAAGTFELRVYRGQPPLTIGDAGVAASGTPVGNASAAARLVARFTFDMTGAAIGSDGAELAANPLVQPATASVAATDLFAVLVATTAYTPASGETFSVVLEGLAF